MNIHINFYSSASENKKLVEVEGLVTGDWKGFDKFKNNEFGIFIHKINEIEGIDSNTYYYGKINNETRVRLKIFRQVKSGGKLSEIAIREYQDYIKE